MTDKKTDFNTLRKRAEAYLANASYEKKDFSELDMQELLHEFHIHQAELEVRNEELTHTLEELETERNRYLDLFESAPVGYAILNAGGLVREVNLVLTDFLGIDRRMVIGRHFSRFVAPGSRSRWYALLQSLREACDCQVLELEMQAPDGAPFPVRLESTPTWEETGSLTGLRIAVSNISPRRTAETERDAAVEEIVRGRDENLRLLERFRMVAESTNSAIFICDAQGFRFVNSAAEQLTGLDRKVLMETRPWRVLKPTERARTEQNLIRALESGRMGQSCTMTVLTARGGERQVEVTVNQVLDGGKPAILGTAIDITVHKEVENDLKRRLGDQTEALSDALRRLEEVTAEHGLSPGAGGDVAREIEGLRVQLDQFKVALEVMYKKREEDRREMEERVTANLNQVVVPEIQNLRKITRDRDILRCLDLLEKELREITSAFTSALTGRYNLTPTEIRIAVMIKEGKTSDEISEHLNVSAKTISYHRNNIRRKLGIHKKKINLRQHLLANAENL